MHELKNQTQFLQNVNKMYVQIPVRKNLKKLL